MPTDVKLPFYPNHFLSKVGTGRSTTVYHKNQVVFAQGEAADALFFLQEGKVKITVVSDLGKEAVISILNWGEFLGEGCLSQRARRSATATTIAECVIMRIEKEAALHLLRDEASFSQLMIAHLLNRVVRVESDLIDQILNSSEKRLARLLLRLAYLGKDSKQDSMIEISQETLACMIGTTRSRVSFFMNKFRRLGFIEYKGSIKVHRLLLDAFLDEQSHIA